MNHEQAKTRLDEAQRRFAAGDASGALAILDELDAAFPNEKNVVYARARCLVALGRSDEAIFLAGQLVALGDLRGEQLRQSLSAGSGTRVGAPQTPVAKAKPNRTVVIAGGAVLVVFVVVVAAMFLRPSTGFEQRADSPTRAESAPSSDAEAGIATTSDDSSRASPAKVTDSKWAWMNDVGPRTPPLPAPKNGEYDEKLCNEVRTIQVPHEKYPGGMCDIQVPTDGARKQYLEQTEFIPSPLKDLGISLAQTSDINHDTSKYGYAYSTKPPACVPGIGYDSNDSPIYYFAGQKVPGTAHWLIDTTSDGKTIPALTTIPFHWFRSINWPRERYAEGIAKARRQDPRSGVQQTARETLEGIVRINGDYSLWEKRAAEILPGTLIAFDARLDVSPIDVAPEVSTGRAAIYVDQGSMLKAEGTPQRPIIFTSTAESPQSADWASVIISKPNPIKAIAYTLSEYGFWNWALNGEMEFHDNISRNTELPSAPPVAEAVFIGGGRPAVQQCEFHNNSISVQVNSDGVKLTDNLIFNNALNFSDHGIPMETIGLMCASLEPKGEVSAERNIIDWSGWGISVECNPRHESLVTSNLLMQCNVSIAINNFKTSDRPVVKKNSFFLNVRGIGVFYTDETPIRFDPMEQQYDPDNVYSPQQPPCRNVLIYDFGV